MRHLVKHRVRKKGIKRNVLTLRLVDQDVGDRHQDFFELGLHCILQLQAASPLLQLNLFIVWQVDGDGLGTCVAVAGRVNDVIGVQVGVGARHLRLVDIVDRQTALQFGKKACEPGELLAPRLVLDQNVGLVSRTISEEPVLVAFDGPDHDFDRVRLDVHPGQVGLLEFSGR